MQTEQIISTAIGIALAAGLAWLQERGKKRSRRRDAMFEQEALHHEREHMLAGRPDVPRPPRVEPVVPPAVPLPEEGMRSTERYEKPSAEAEADAAAAEAARLEAHRRRWRHAMIDSQILTPKF